MVGEWRNVVSSDVGQQGGRKSLLIKGAVISDHLTSFQGDMLITDGKIAALAAHIDAGAQACEVIDAEGLVLVPGGIDVHTHFNIDVGIARSCDDFFTGTRSAACGGTTTIVDHMGFGPEGCDLFHQLRVYKAYAKESAVIDYSFHGVIQHIDDAILGQMEAMVHEEGISSFKLYLTYGYKLDDEAAFKALRQLKKVGAITAVHPENDAAISAKREQLISEGKTSAKYHAASRPLECEAEAVARMINLAKLADDAPLYIVHLSNGLGLDYTRIARAAKQSVWVETCPQYLTLDERSYERPDAVKFVLSPPLRNASECDKLWVGLADGSIDTVATDHCAFTTIQKQPGDRDFTQCPNGIPGVELRMPLLFSEGVSKGRIDLPRFVELTSYKPARLFGLYPQKGSLAVGSDADVVLFDPAMKTTITHENLNDNCDYTPFENQACDGWPVLTLSRGAVVAAHGQFTGKAGMGRFLKRKPFSGE
ncbi:dihydropyrimidinase [Reinekea marinisedimentorum]|uniref:Dihydropyrimidinase n=1 Tax=Reinekea marinisedimentorum TaxID=230495 RepID=A0A4R3I5K6_9GAMM|nr:dihydropyrimidinase [Reinekea marinisedimentorum]TCS41277.1 dihydropyrimidinase [Reinekea marinisedimentorum]